MSLGLTQDTGRRSHSRATKMYDMPSSMWALAAQTAPERSHGFDAALVELLRVQVILHIKSPVAVEGSLPDLKIAACMCWHLRMLLSA